MKYRMLSSRILGLAVIAALALLAFSATVAQAANLEDGGKEALFQTLKSGPLIAGETFTGELENLTATFGSKTEARLHLLWLIPNLNLTILCGALTVLSGKFNTDKEALAEIRLSGCKAFNLAGTEELTNCIITSKAEGGEKGVYVALGRGLPRKHEGESYVLLEPDAGETFGTLFFEKGKGCPLTLTNPIKGKFDALLAKPESNPVLITSNEAIQTLMFGKVAITFGAQPMVFDFNALVRLIGTDKLCEFGVV